MIIKNSFKSITMKILKFGGTSVANAQNIKLVIDIVSKKQNMIN